MKMKKLVWLMLAVQLGCATIETADQSSYPEAGPTDQSLLPVYVAADLNLNTSILQPVRLLYDPSEGINGFADGLFTDRLYSSPQVAIALERTVYYPSPDRVRDAIRIRWSANTHPHIDEILVDAKTLATVNERTRSGRNWQTRDELIFVRNGHAQVMVASDEGFISQQSYPLRYSEHYGLMALPFLFAAMELEPGVSFRLPALGSNEETFIEISVGSKEIIQDNNGDSLSTTKVTSSHGWGQIDWYVSPEPPFHHHAVWRYLTDGIMDASAVSRVIDWNTFDLDVFEGVVDATILDAQAK